MLRLSKLSLMRYLVIIGCILGLFSGCKRGGLNVPQANVTTMLTAYGQSNPEKQVAFKTNLGEVVVQLYEDTPLHRANFIRLVKNNYYQWGVFYRVVNGLLVQGGDPNVARRVDFTVPNEMKNNHFHRRGAIAMAHYDEGNPNKNSSASEFYIVDGRRYSNGDLDDLRKTGRYSEEQLEIFKKEGGYADLDDKYTVFGEVISGMEIIQQLSNAKLMGDEKPLRPVDFTVSIK
jgi:peptidyl-prolyl cis-trans isomerase B (cyclophilin B)